MLDLSHWSYIQAVSFNCDLQSDTARLLTINGKQATANHCASVALQSRMLAARFGLDAEKLAAAALLHDISNVIKPQDMLSLARERGWSLDAAEERHPFLLHQRVSAVFAAELFGVADPVILSAIGCHTTLKSNPSHSDTALFLADKLAWDQDGIPPFCEAVTEALEKSLACAALVYINYVLENGMILHPHQWLIDAKAWLEASV